ncbi:hypothetical protein GCM10010495_73020 [Kitasatospora herbaricolor]|nr:hypothetical protein GCM10010495_73020 [Kitasatospora herbaricolor]
MASEERRVRRDTGMESSFTELWVGVSAIAALRGMAAPRHGDGTAVAVTWRAVGGAAVRYC